MLFTTPKLAIFDIDIKTDIVNDDGKFNLIFLSSVLSYGLIYEESRLFTQAFRKSDIHNFCLLKLLNFFHVIKGFIAYNVQTTSINETEIRETLELDVIAYDKEDVESGRDSAKVDLKGILQIPNVKKWWPYLMDPEPGYLYTVEVSIILFRKVL